MVRLPGLTRNPASPRRPQGPFVVLFLIVFLLLAAMYGALALNKGIRGYSAGESQWSKSRKEAVHQLDRYLIGGGDAHWERFERGLAVPLADRRARLEMDRRDFDYDAAFDHFVAGANHPADVPMMIRLYRWFAWQDRFARVIDAWAEADRYILQLAALGAQVRHAYEIGEMTPERRRGFGAELERIDQGAARMETEFSTRLGEAARWLQGVLAVVLLSSSLVLLALGGYIVRHTTARVFTARTFEAEERFRRTFEVAPVGIFHMALDGTWTDVNDSMCRMLGYPPEKLVGAREADFLAPGEDGEGGFQPAMPEDADRFVAERHYLRADGYDIVVHLSITLVRDIAGRPLNYVAVAHDVTESRRLARELSYRARHDALTGLYNRYEFERRLKTALGHSASESLPGVVAFLDLDQFKVVNDTCGHTAGDAMLTQVAAVIRGCLRSNDTLARLGGDEFGILLEACSIERAQVIAKKIRSEVAAFRFPWEGRSFSLGVSIGLVPFSGGGDDDATRLLSVADTACYRAKEAGRNQINVARVGDASIRRHQDEMRWLQRLEEAHSDSRFQLVWEPIMPADYRADEIPRRFEVLLRMRDHDGAVIQPGSFLPAAERYGQILKLDQWVLTTLLEWLGRNPETAGRIDQVNVNVSGAALSNPEYIGRAKSLLSAARFPVDRLCFEITETMAISNINAAIAFMRHMSAMGCRFALDDFGIGVSSFAYLNSLPVDYVKIDGVFVRDIDQDPVHASIVKCVNDVAHSMGKGTVAEFVETAAVRAKLLRLGCDAVQGYAIGRALPLGDFRLLPLAADHEGEDSALA